MRSRIVHAAGLMSIAMLALCAASAQASSIAFLRGGNVWIAGSDGSQPRQLTSDGGSDPSVSYSFVSASKAGTPLLGYRHANSIGVINPDGSAERNVAPGHAPAVGPDTVLSANGQVLTYISVYPPALFDGDTVNIDGSSPTHLGRDGVIDVAPGDPVGASVIWSGQVHDAYGTAFGPDCTVGIEPEPYGLAVATPDRDGGPENIPASGYFCIIGQNVTQPRISADGSTVLATLAEAGGSTRIISFPRAEMTAPFNPAAPSFTYVTPPGLNASYGDFSPDGTQIAFQGPNNTIYTIPAGGGTPTQILSEAAVPAWGPYSLPGAAGGPGPGPGPGVAAHCNVPKLLGRTLAAARKAISRAHCRVGRITRRRSSRRSRGRVISESPKAGRTLAGATKVNFALGR